MKTMTFTGVTVDVNDDGFFTTPEEWTEGMAPEIAAAEGVDDLSPEHWHVIRFVRACYLEGERPPSVRLTSKRCGVPAKRLYQLFPQRPIKKAAKIAGIPEPRLYLGGCIASWGPRG